MGFIEGEDSWYLVNKGKEGIDNLKNFIREDGRIDLLRDLIEIEESLKRFPTDNSYE